MEQVIGSHQRERSAYINTEQTNQRIYQISYNLIHGIWFWHVENLNAK